MNKIQPGIYSHYKGPLYEVLGYATHSETEERLVLYRALYGDFEMWARPAKMFEEKIQCEGKLVPRFTLLKAF